jgi:hypothetical protein
MHIVADQGRDPVFAPFTIQSTQMYLHADLSIKQRALDRTVLPRWRQGATRLQTRCSPSWTACDYADQNSARTAADQVKRRPSGGYSA